MAIHGISAAVPTPVRNGDREIGCLRGRSRQDTPAAHKGLLPRWCGETESTIELVQGKRAEYYCEAHRCWIPCAITHVDAETGSVELSAEPGRVLNTEQQQRRLRPLTKPSQARLEWARKTLREGRFDEEAQLIFERHLAVGGVRVLGERANRGFSTGLCFADLDDVASELDSSMGISGSVLALRQAAQAVDGRTLSLDRFSEVFWTLLWDVQSDYCQALSCCTEQCAVPPSQQSPFRAYKIGKTLGQGNFGVVQLATHHATGIERALKIVQKGEVWDQVDELMCEISHLSVLDHPNIVRLYEHYEDANSIFLVMDYCSGGDLYSLVTQTKHDQRRLPESFAAGVMRQLLWAISHVHARGVVHLDVKSPNIMLMPYTVTTADAGDEANLPCGGGFLSTLHRAARVTPANAPHVMLVDLGVAQIFRPGNFRLHNPAGTPATMAPEVWKGEIHPKADIFSCGTVFFEQLSLSLPFNCRGEPEEAIRYWMSKPQAPWPKLQYASGQAIDLCRRMLSLERHTRPAAPQCLVSPFLVRSSSEDIAQLPEDLLRHFSGMPKKGALYKSIALALARTWPANRLLVVAKLFDALDAARSGRLRKEELEAGLAAMGLEREHARDVAVFMDMSRDGTVSWTEFVASCLNLGSGFYDDDLQGLFNMADADADGLLSRQDLAKLLLAEQLKEVDAVADIFTDLVGRTEEGARLDWPTFRHHFDTTGDPTAGCIVASGAGRGLAVVAGSDGTLAARGAAELLEQLCYAVVESARSLLWPCCQQEATKLSEPSEEDFKQLAELGFTDQERCRAKLQQHHNRFSLLLVEELFAEDEKKANAEVVRPTVDHL